MAHAASFWRREAREIADLRFGHVALDPCRRLGFLGPADFADHHDRGGFRIALEQHQMVQERAAIDRIAANADARRDADSTGIHLRRGFIAKRARTGTDTDRAAHIDMTRHDPEHRLAGADDPRAVRPDQQGPMIALIAQKIALHPHHVLRGYAVGDRAYEPDPRV